MVEKVEHWFNSRSDLGRRDIYLLRTENGWQVLGRLGGFGGHEVTYQLADERDARAMVKRMRDATPLRFSSWIKLSQSVGRYPSW